MDITDRGRQGARRRGKNCIISACGGAELTLKRSTTTHVPVGRWCIFITPATAPHSADAVLVLFALGVRSDSRQNLPKPRNNLPLHIPESTWTCYLWLGSWSALSTLAVSPRPHFGKRKFVLFLQRVIRYTLLLFNGFTLPCLYLRVCLTGESLAVMKTTTPQQISASGPRQQQWQWLDSLGGHNIRFTTKYEFILIPILLYGC